MLSSLKCTVFSKHSWHSFLMFYPSAKLTLINSLYKRKKSIKNKLPQTTSIPDNPSLNQNCITNIWNIPKSAQSKQNNMMVFLLSSQWPIIIILDTFNSGKITRSTKFTFNIPHSKKTDQDTKKKIHIISTGISQTTQYQVKFCYFSCSIICQYTQNIP